MHGVSVAPLYVAPGLGITAQGRVALPSPRRDSLQRVVDVWCVGELGAWRKRSQHVGSPATGADVASGLGDTNRHHAEEHAFLGWNPRLLSHVASQQCCLPVSASCLLAHHRPLKRVGRGLRAWRRRETSSFSTAFLPSGLCVALFHSQASFPGHSPLIT